ncbi:FliH/SctL family protein [Novosphingobium sp. Leaf2]|uniref:FliH/SctL family protein n=1 Tax=Novosphingobium sp. Leaf2 TaxID=1735670 RepID=UPI0006F92686|nr:FliH/SctL family protein [Novosphingobium sp. Leaf2]KQM14826.1 flagellar biosynthesis protein [Novosphingobium sp. Leaf2]
MSDMGFSLGAPMVRPRLSLVEALGQPGAFRANARFGGLAVLAAATPPVLDAPDILAETYARGYAEGHAQAQTEAAAVLLAHDTAHQALSLAFARIDAQLEEDLRARLRDTVAALCEAALGPLALDANALATRIQRAVAMLSRADDERVVRLHPADIALLSDCMAADWTVRPDPSLERGTVRVETASGGVEDGPATWRAAIAEAMHDA